MLAPSTKDEPVCPMATQSAAPSCRHPMKRCGAVSGATYVWALNQPKGALPSVAVSWHQPEAVNGVSGASVVDPLATLSANHETALPQTEPPISPGAQPAEARWFF